MSLKSAFDPRSNSLNAIRLGLALLVMVSHSWALGGAGAEPELGGANLGTWAVFGFFGISGYLITRSRLSGHSVRQFYRARFLRLFPGFLVCLLAVAFVFAPLSRLWDPAGSFSILDQLGYILRNILLYPPFLGQYDIGSTLSAVPFTDVWNGPLWTLFWEASCYVLVGVAASLLPRRVLGPLLAATLVIASVATLAAEQNPVVPLLITRTLPMLAAFAGGAVMFLYDEKFIRRWAVPGAVGMLVMSVLTQTATTLAPLPFTYLLFVLSAIIPLQRVGSRFDVSYGVYIYGWPVQQVVALIAGDSLPVWVFVGLSVAATVPLAYLSCRYVEQPALAFKNGRAAATAVAAGGKNRAG
ncbi:peptidoglycan/LPS O-acetylase OafA/YrhL [Arthrobacter sp. UYCu512]|uniref:acyltransferase family protein n=1 Tax=Arthrobacter sp. UYCu512 TaxID=3156338 RepID=UPI003399287F